MNFDNSMDVLIHRYLTEVKKYNISIEEISMRPRWKRVWYWWRGLEYFNGKPMPEISLEECKKIYGD